MKRISFVRTVLTQRSTHVYYGRKRTITNSFTLCSMSRTIRLQRRFASSQAISSSEAKRPRTAIFFPGQGVQKVGMLEPWLAAFPRTARPLVEEIDTMLGYKISEIIARGPSATLTETQHAQPAIMAASVLILRVLENEFDFKIHKHVDVTLGHSLGEFAALVAGGYVSFQDSLFLVKKRAEAFAKATRQATEEHGSEFGMVALVTDEGHLAPLVESINSFLLRTEPGCNTHMFEQVLIANVNSKNQIVLSGNLGKIKALLTHVRVFGGHDPRAVQLKSDSPFHSPLMEPATILMRNLLAGKSTVKGQEHEDIVRWPGVMECISNVTARPFSNKEELKDLWARQATETVRWWDSIKYLDQEQKVRRWIGIGPGKVGRNLVGKEVGMKGKDIIKGGGVWGINDPKEIEEVLRGLEETEEVIDEE